MVDYKEGSVPHKFRNRFLRESGGNVMVSGGQSSGGSGESCQYAEKAEVANKLANARTLWGQEFDGTEDVKGELHDVTEIFNDGNIDVSPGGKFVVNAEEYVDGDLEVNGTITSVNIENTNIISSKKIVAEDATMEEAKVTGKQTFGTFNKGLTGAEIDGTDGSAEMGSLVLRESLTVPKLVYNRTEVQAGNVWRTVGGGEIDTVTPNADGTGVITLKLEDGEIGMVAVGDLCQGVYHLSSGNDTSNTDGRNGNFTFAGFKTIYFEVIEILNTDDNSQFTYKLRSVTDTAWTDATHPQKHMNFAVYGNRSNAQRQASALDTTQYHLLLAGVTGWTYSSTNIQYIEGYLTGFNIDCRYWDKAQQKYVDGTKTLTGYGIAFGKGYMWGNIEQFDRKPSLVSQQIKYLATVYSSGITPSSAGWTNEPQTATKEKPYLWQYYVQTFSDDTTKNTDPYIAANYVEDAPQPNLMDMTDSSKHGRGKWINYGQGVVSVDESETFNGMKALKVVVGSTGASGAFYTNDASWNLSGMIPVSPNTTYTYSFYMKKEVACASWNALISIFYKDSEGTEKTIDPTIVKSLRYVNKANEWARLYVTFTTPESEYALYLRLYVYMENSAMYGKNMWFCQPKLEVGSVATAWCISENDKIGPQGEQGIQGIQGPVGPDGKTLYTWVKYADDAQGTNMSDYPDGKPYLGIAYNKNTSAESTNPNDYTWSKIEGEEGQPGTNGVDGQTYYTWIKYADVASPTSAQMYDTPTANTQYIGIAVNKTTATESTDPADYTWSKFKGDTGAAGASALSCQLSSPVLTVGLSSNGNVISATELSTTLAMYYGTTLQSMTNILIPPNLPTGVTATITVSTGEIKITIAQNATFTNDCFTFKVIGICSQGNSAINIVVQGVRVGANGDTGLGISSVVNYYKLSATETAPEQPSVSTDPTSSGWSTTAPETDSTNRFMWSFTRYAWTNGTVTQTGVVLASVRGEDGSSIEIKGSAIAYYDSYSQMTSTATTDGVYLCPLNQSGSRRCYYFTKSGSTWTQGVATVGDTYITNNGHLYVAQTIGWLDAGELKGPKGDPGTNGEDAKRIYLSITPDQVVINASGVRSASQITATAYEKTGSGNPAVVATYYIRATPVVSSGVPRSSGRTGSSLTVSTENVLGYVFELYSANPNLLGSNAVLLDIRTITFVNDGATGARGYTGPMARPRGEWAEGTAYVYDETYRDIVIYNDSYYAVKRENSSVTTVPTNTDDWEVASDFKFVATDLLLAQLAYINNLGVNNLIVRDSNGVYGGFCLPDGQSELGLGDVRLWLGNTSPTSAPFRVDKNGNVVMQKATVAGKVTASMFYGSSKIAGVPTGSTSATIDVVNDPATCYIITVGSGQTLYLPTPDNYLGLELTLVITNYTRSSYNYITAPTGRKIYSLGRNLDSSNYLDAGKEFEGLGGNCVVKMIAVNNVRENACWLIESITGVAFANDGTKEYYLTSEGYKKQ